ncbi:MAG: hypothetical protein WDM77_20245 [Steroidobacteraceae bacterium]
MARLVVAALIIGLSPGPAAWAAAPAASNAPFISSDAVTGSRVGGEYTGPRQPAPRDAAGRVQLTGYWKPLPEKDKPGGNIGKDQPHFQLPLTEAGKQALKRNLTQTIDPESLCIEGGIPRLDASGIPFQILQTPQQIGFLYYLGYRVVAVGRQHDPDPDPTYFGDATSRWEGDTLVVDVVGFKGSEGGKFWADENGNPESAHAHVVERWTRPDYHHIHLDLRVNDPEYYSKPFTFARTWIIGDPGEKLNEYACSENNVDAPHLLPGPGPIGADGNRGGRYMIQKLPDEPPPPEFYEHPASGR